MSNMILGLCVLLVSDDNEVANLRLNQIQVVGTHNSYHQRPAPAMLASAIRVNPAAKEWDYSRLPLAQQLDHGIRSFELDMHLLGNEWLVMHVPVFDPNSSCKTFGDALRQVKAWSDKHPRHVPISFLMECKEEGFAMSKKFRQPERADIERLEAIIREVFSREQIITPDDARPKGNASASPRGAWPTLSQAAGKVLFILHETGRNRENYVADHPTLEGRLMFVNSDPDAPHAGAIVMDNPNSNIADRAREGFFIRTRADGRENPSASRREKALASGAHILSTDYPAGEYPSHEAFGFPDEAPARINPVTGPANRAGQAILEPIP
ncbi:phosphatidylinositol-specific phospholipase C1-like protein [bacterium]|nr:phosphatidylinositol-specific phospholipase C1-like protein [bacterium]